MTAAEIAATCQRIVERGTKPSLPEVKPIVEAYYLLPGNGAGGELHVVLDDGNTKPYFIASTLKRTEKTETQWLCRVLLMLSPSQRRRL